MIRNTITYDGPPPSLSWQVLLPAGWSYLGTIGGEATGKPTPGAAGLAEWTWTSLPTSPVTFSYVVGAAAGSPAEDQALAALVTVQPAGSATQFLAQPDPLLVGHRHSVDTDRNGKIDLFELTRVIELYNTRNATIRTGRYVVLPETEDGFAADPTSTGGAPIPGLHRHTADVNHDGRIDLVELTRVIELFNTRTGTSRTGSYRVQTGSEDGFAPTP